MKRTNIYKFVSNPPFRDTWRIDTQNHEVTQIQYTEILADYFFFLVTSASVVSFT